MNIKSLKIPLSRISVRDRAIILELIVKVSISSFSSPGEYLKTMSAINICRMTFKDARLKQKSHFNILSCFGVRRKSILGSLGSGTQ